MTANHPEYIPLNFILFLLTPFCYRKCPFVTATTNAAVVNLTAGSADYSPDPVWKECPGQSTPLIDQTGNAGWPRSPQLGWDAFFHPSIP